MDKGVNDEREIRAAFRRGVGVDIPSFWRKVAQGSLLPSRQVRVELAARQVVAISSILEMFDDNVCIRVIGIFDFFDIVLELLF